MKMEKMGLAYSSRKCPALAGSQPLRKVRALGRCGMAP
jgi:hypothetical protein